MLGTEKEERSEPPHVGCYVSELESRQTLPFLIPFDSFLQVLTKPGMFSQFAGYYQHSRNVFLVQT
jgi:hypothetical protein